MQTQILSKLALILATVCLGKKAPGADPRFKLERWPIPSLVSSALLVLVLLNHALAATGPIRIAKDFPHSFQYQSGERFSPWATRPTS